MENLITTEERRGGGGSFLVCGNKDLIGGCMYYLGYWSKKVSGCGTFCSECVPEKKITLVGKEVQYIVCTLLGYFFVGGMSTRLKERKNEKKRGTRWNEMHQINPLDLAIS